MENEEGNIVYDLICDHKQFGNDWNGGAGYGSVVYVQSHFAVFVESLIAR